MAKIAILGFGTVGSGVYEVLCRNAAGVSRRAGEPVEVKYILDPKDFSGHPAANLFVKSIDTILQDPEVREVREVPSRPVGRCPSPHRTRAPASVRSDVPSCRSSPVDRSCRSSLPSDLPENSGSSVYAEGSSAVRPCAAKYRRLCATAADCGRTSAARSFQAQACFKSPNLSQQTHRPSAGA